MKARCCMEKLLNLTVYRSWETSVQFCVVHMTRLLQCSLLCVSVDFSIQVLSSGSWPFNQSCTFTLPPEVSIMFCANVRKSNCLFVEFFALAVLTCTVYCRCIKRSRLYDCVQKRVSCLQISHIFLRNRVQCSCFLVWSPLTSSSRRM